MSKQKCVKNRRIKPTDEELCKIVSKSIAQVIRFSLDEGFREKTFKTLDVSSTKEAEEQIRIKLASMVSGKTKDQDKTLSSKDASTSSQLLDSLNSSNDLTECRNSEETVMRHDVNDENGSLCKDAENVQNNLDSIISAESVQATLITLTNSSYKSSEVASSQEPSHSCNFASQDLLNDQEERISTTQNLLSEISRENQNVNLQKRNSQISVVTEKEESEILNINENCTDKQNEQPLSSESQQSTNSQSSSLSQEIFEKNWLEISTSKCLKGKRLHRDWESSTGAEISYFSSNSQDLSLLNEGILLSNSQNLFDEEYVPAKDETNIRKSLKWSEQNFLEANMKRQKTQNLRSSLLMDI